MFIRILLLFIFTSSKLIAQDHALVPYYKGGLWEFAKSDGSIAIEPAYIHVTTFGEFGNAVVTVKTDRGYMRGLIDAQGRIIIDPKYVLVKSLSKDFVEVQKGMYKALFKNGKAITKFRYKSIHPISDNLFSVSVPDDINSRTGKVGAIKIVGDDVPEFIPYKYSYLNFDEERKMFVGVIVGGVKTKSDFYTQDGSLSSEDVYNAIGSSADNIQESIAPDVVRKNSLEGKAQKIEKKRSQESKQRYDRIIETSIPGKYIAYLQTQYDLIDQDGIELVPLIYNDIQLSGKRNPHFFIKLDDGYKVLNADLDEML